MRVTGVTGLVETTGVMGSRECPHTGCSPTGLWVPSITGVQQKLGRQGAQLGFRVENGVQGRVLGGDGEVQGAAG